jgi:rubrerythrin
MRDLNEIEKEFICRRCCIFLNTVDLEDSKCPACKTDGDIFLNDLIDDSDEYI